MSEQAQSSGHEWRDASHVVCCECQWCCSQSIPGHWPAKCRQEHAAHVASVAQPQEVPAPDYARIIAEDDATLKAMREKQNPEWRTVIVGLPILRKLLNGEDVTLESFRINLIPDDVLFNARPK